MNSNGATTDYWAVVTRGLEQVVHDELLDRVPDLHDVDVTYRRVAFSTGVDPEALLALRTPDDLFVDLAPWERIDHRRAGLAVLGEQARLLDLRDAAAVCATIRELGTPPNFSVTANFVGRRNYSTDEIKSALSSGIEAGHGWPYQPRDAEADLNIRIFIEHERAFLGMRLAAAPLHERTYKVATIAGSLKPTVAAAMVRLGDFMDGSVIIDPLCGAGTIPIEAALMGLHAVGGDQDEAALAAARANQAAAGVAVQLERWDARTTPLADSGGDGVACNLPWGRQVATGDGIERFYGDCLCEMARIVRPGGRIVLLTNLQPLLRASAVTAGLTLRSEIEISLSGQRPHISILSKDQRTGGT